MILLNINTTFLPYFEHVLQLPQLWKQNLLLTDILTQMTNQFSLFTMETKLLVLKRKFLVTGFKHVTCNMCLQI